MKESSNFNDIVAKPLKKETKEDWFDWVKNYLISQDLWKVTSRSARPERYSVKDFARWRRKNAKALHVIRISCGPHNLSFIRKASEAKFAWDILYHAYNAPPPPPPLPPEELDMGILYKAIYNNNWSAAKAFIDAHPSVLDPQLAATTGETPLHVATKLGLVGIVEEFVRLVPSQYLEILDANGNTPLLIAASHSGVIPIAKCLINKNSNTLAIPVAGNESRVPVNAAFLVGLREMGHYLYSVTPLHVFQLQNGPVGPQFLTLCLEYGDLDIVLDLLQRCKELLFATDIGGNSTISNIAYFLPNYPNKSQLPLWKQWVSHYIKIPSTTTTEHFCVDIQQGNSNNAHQGQGLLHWLISCIYNLSGMKEIRKMKQQHAQAAEILNLVCDSLIVLNEEKKHMLVRALELAAIAENVEFCLRVTKANPELISSVTFAGSKTPFFFNAVANRKAEILNLLRGFRFKHVVANIVSSDGNTLLHVTAMLAPTSCLNRISGAALQMQRELQWFKAVESIVDPGDRTALNDEWLNPLELFKEKHRELRNEGEKWMKETSSSCSVVGALIVTIMFAVAFTVPGGNDQATGYPIFFKERLFKVFLIADALSLFSSTTSVLTFLGILTSRYAEEDFFYSLPKKLIIGLSTLFLSIATMMIAFSAAIIIMLQHNSPRLWILPVILLAGVPITLFVLLQFPLLVEIISATYGQGIFKKKVKTWP